MAALLLALATPALAMGGGGGGGGMGGGMGGGGMNGGMGSGDMGEPGPMHDHEMALEQHQRGMAPSLTSLMRQIRRKYPGKVLDVRVERAGQAAAYVFTIMQGNRIRQVRIPLSGASETAERRRTFNFRSGRER